MELIIGSVFLSGIGICNWCVYIYNWGELVYVIGVELFYVIGVELVYVIGVELVYVIGVELVYIIGV